MAIQLTPEQAAVTAVEIAAAPGSFEGSQEELEQLLLQGMASREVSEEEFWDSVEQETGAMLAAHKPLPRL